ncbi:hypothetical protein [Actinoplanes couchii]|uniref:Uncharacterized protein n=1 Tax=Actinoplanes couchii TaxID=403638 RepID=A0ABQ3XBQ6_9ACTN|nr:hypothetical protein [Actinoplanes couchii]MDR6323347.1 hypothetical protein [Actinoplanes couchii]GID55860.1 hypothetical protein Aco03nite_042640 [Actinoplanes couchii]
MTDRPTAPETVEESRLTVALIAVAALGWAVAMLWSARATITGRADAAMEVTSTAYALPGAVSADLAAGAAVALLTLTLIGSRRPLGATARFAVATGAGLLVGLLSAVVMVTINTAGTMYAVVGGTVAAAATIGGALAGLRLPSVVAGATAASVGVFLVGFTLNLFQEPVLELFGAGDTASAANASQWFSYSQAALSGLTAGLIAYAIMRRAHHRAGGGDLRWPLYALAGAGPGILLVVAELLSRTAGAQVLELAGKVSDLEQVVQQMLSTARLNNGLIVLFVGTLTALFAVGRTLSPASGDDDLSPSSDSAASAAVAPTSPAAAPSSASAAPSSASAAPSSDSSAAASASSAAASPDSPDSDSPDSLPEFQAGGAKTVAQSSSSSSETAYHSNS